MGLPGNTVRVCTIIRAGELSFDRFRSRPDCIHGKTSMRKLLLWSRYSSEEDCLNVEWCYTIVLTSKPQDFSRPMVSEDPKCAGYGKGRLEIIQGYVLKCYAGRRRWNALKDFSVLRM